MQRRSEATAKRDNPIDTETLTAKRESKGVKTENMEDIGIVMRTMKARRNEGETELETRVTGMVNRR